MFGRVAPQAGTMQLLLVLSMATLLTLLQAQLDEKVVLVRTGQELADAVANWGASGSNTTIQIAVPFISVRNASFLTKESIAARAGTEPFSSGRLIVRGLVNSDGSPATVLDAGMRQNLTDGLSQTAQVELISLVILNLCDDIGAPGPLYAIPWGIFLFRGSPVTAAVSISNLVMFGRQASMDLVAYSVAVQAVTVPQVRNAVVNTMGVSGLVGQLSDELTQYTAGVSRFDTLLFSAVNVTIKAIENPDDPQVAEWKSRGLLMPARKCDGSAAVDAATLRQTAPIWIALQQSTFAAQLEQAAAYTAVPRLLRAFPVVLVMAGDSVTAPDVVTHTVSGRLLFMSKQQANLVSWDQQITMNLNQRVHLLNIVPGADLIIQWLGLTGLAVQVPTRLPPSLAGRSPDSLLPSVFPLAAFNTSAGPDTWNSTAQIIMANVTLAIPPDEYMALFILTSQQGKAGAPSCADPTISQRVDQLQAGISSWAGSSAGATSLQQHIQQLDPDLFLDTFTGWGLNATLLRLVPTGPLVMPTCSPSPQSGMTRPQIVGLAVGVACGFVLLMAALASLVVWNRRRRRAAVSLSARGPSSKADDKLDSIAPEAVEKKLCESDTTSATSARPASAVSSQTSLVQYLHRAHASHEQVFSSLAARTAPSSSTTPSAQPQSQPSGFDQKQLHGQVAELAAKLQPHNDQLVLAGVLGSGHGGVVYMGVWRGLQVAVKTVVFHESHDSSNVAVNERVILETAICASLGHRNVVASYHYDIKALKDQKDLQTAGGLQIDMAPGSRKSEQHAYKVYLIQELCDISLAGALHDGLLLRPGTGDLDMRGVLSVLLDIASGLGYLHSKGIIHGDLKPANVLLKLDSASEVGVVAKLTDFGLSTQLLPGHTHVSDYRSGTPFYVAPEVTAHHQVSPASDMYSWGVVCWELFVQQRPYKTNAQGQYIWNPLFPDYPPAKSPPPEYITLNHRCLHRNHQMRPTAREAVQALEAMLRTSPMHAR